jgi:hypothetical protein
MVHGPRRETRISIQNKGVQNTNVPCVSPSSHDHFHLDWSLSWHTPLRNQSLSQQYVAN